MYSLLKRSLTMVTSKSKTYTCHIDIQNIYHLELVIVVKLLYYNKIYGTNGKIYINHNMNQSKVKFDSVKYRQGFSQYTHLYKPMGLYLLKTNSP